MPSIGQTTASTRAWTASRETVPPGRVGQVGGGVDRSGALVAEQEQAALGHGHLGEDGGPRHRVVGEIRFVDLLAVDRQLAVLAAGDGVAADGDDPLHHGGVRPGRVAEDDDVAAADVVAVDALREHPLAGRRWSGPSRWSARCRAGRAALPRRIRRGTAPVRARRPRWTAPDRSGRSVRCRNRRCPGPYASCSDHSWAAPYPAVPGRVSPPRARCQERRRRHSTNGTAPPARPRAARPSGRPRSASACSGRAGRRCPGRAGWSSG